MRNLFLIAFTLLSALFRAQVSTGSASVCGKVTDQANGNIIAAAPVALEDAFHKKSNMLTDMNGSFCFKNIANGSYTLTLSYLGYENITRTIEVQPGKIVNLKLEMKASLSQLDEISVKTEIVSYQAPVASRNYPGKKKIFNSNRNVSSGYNYPNFNTEEYKKTDDNEFREVTKDPLSTMSIDVDRASYSNVRRFITQGSLPPADAVRVEEMINYFSYDYPQPKGDVPFSINTEFTDCPWNKKHQIVHIGIQGKEIKTDKLPANNLVFLIDVSGSMSDDNKLPLVKSGLRLLVDQLRTQDKVSLVVYAGNAGLVLPATSGTDKEKIMEAIENLEAGGSTAGGQGIELAYKQAKESFIKEGNNRVILATDGDFNVGVSSDGELIRLIEKKREEGVFLTVLGFGTGNYKDSKMEQLADKGNGNYAYIDNIFEAKKVLVKEMGGTLLTIAKDVKIQIEFNPAKVKAYRLVGYENRLLNKEDFNDDKKDAGELGSGHTVTAIYEIVPAGSEEGWASVDDLKYQKTVTAPISSGNEILTVKFRYKDPKEIKSKLITEVVTNVKSAASENCRFACAVAEFGMILRDSKFKGESDFKSVIALAKQSKGKDEEGYRAEFIRLIETAELLKK